MILFTGRGTSGSWQIRGVQLGSKIGKVVASASLKQMRAADVIVLVKRPTPALLADIQRSGKPWVWDVVDAYPQPECTRWTAERAVGYIRGQLRKYRPAGVIWPNKRMWRDCGGGKNETVTYHHFNPVLRAGSVRNRIRVVGYEGSRNYIDGWAKHIRRECARRGWEFRPHGPIDRWDAVVAFRDPAHNGYAQWAWKSNVKLANAHGAGVPFIGATECGYTETAVGGEIWCDRPGALSEAFDTLAAADRKAIQKRFIRAAFSVDEAAEQVRRFIHTL